MSHYVFNFRLERSTLTGFDLPHIHVPPAQQQQQRTKQQPQQAAHLITNKLSRQLKLRGRLGRSSSITSLHDHLIKNNNNNNNDDLQKKVVSRPATTTSRVLQTSKSGVELSKPEKVPEPCRSCGRNDLPERFHTHGPNLDHPGKNRQYVFFLNTCFPNTPIPTMTLSQTAISLMDYTKSPQSGPRDTPFESEIHHKAGRENDVRDNVMVGIGVSWETFFGIKTWTLKILVIGPCNVFGQGQLAEW